MVLEGHKPSDLKIHTRGLKLNLTDSRWNLNVPERLLMQESKCKSGLVLANVKVVPAVSCIVNLELKIDELNDQTKLKLREKETYLGDLGVPIFKDVIDSDEAKHYSEGLNQDATDCTYACLVRVLTLVIQCA